MIQRSRMEADGNRQPEGKPVSDSEVFMGRQMMPDDANPWGYVHGGVIMKMVDEAAGSAAIRHARCRVATAAVDYMSFLSPVHIGDLVTLRASVNDVGKTSMEVGVRVETENMVTGERRHTSSAYVVMVAMAEDEDQPIQIPSVIAETPEQRRRQAAAKIRRAQRKILQARIEASAEELDPPAVASGLVPVGPKREGE